MPTTSVRRQMVFVGDRREEKGIAVCSHRGTSVGFDERISEKLIDSFSTAANWPHEVDDVFDIKRVH